MKRELSTAWWNVIRRKLRATDATAIEDPEARCPDCDSSMWLRSGRYGRYYTCDRMYQCVGSLGARLDGTVIHPKGRPELVIARREARSAVARVVVARNTFARYIRPNDPPYRPCSPWIEDGKPEIVDADVRDDFAAIVSMANLNRLAIPGRRRVLANNFFVAASLRAGLYIKRRSTEECARICDAAGKRRLDIEKEIGRPIAWDRLTLLEAAFA